MPKKEVKKSFNDYFPIVKHKLPYWEELPDIELYMDQVIALMNKYLSFHRTAEDQDIVTHSMINNYVKLGIMPAPEKKRYSRVHLAYLLIICSLKQALPIADVKNLIEIRVKRTSIEQTLNYYADIYDQIYNVVIAIGRKYSNMTEIDDEHIFPDTALYMAVGSSMGKYVAMEIAKMNKKEEE